MTTVAVLPVKRFGSAKQRLGDLPEREALAAGMVERVLAAVCGAALLDRVLVVTGDADAAALARDAGAEVVDEPELLGHSGAALLGVQRALALAATRALLVPGDCPLLTAEDVDGLLARHEDADGVVVFPDRHGTGTNALLLAPPDAIAPAFGPGSRARHVGLAEEAGARVIVDDAVAALLLDVDTPDDLDAVRAARRA